MATDHPARDCRILPEKGKGASPQSQNGRASLVTESDECLAFVVCNGLSFVIGGLRGRVAGSSLSHFHANDCHLRMELRWQFLFPRAHGDAPIFCSLL